MVPISQIGDGQIQAPQKTATAVISQIGDGQIQAPRVTAPAISQIGDGQIQAPKVTAPAVSQIGDGQIQAPKPTAPAISQIGDGQIQAPKPTAPAVTQIGDGQIQAPGKSQTASGAVPAVSQIADGQPQAGNSTRSGGVVACANNSTLSVTLKNGVLLDSQGRTGYIASNYQFQFDAPAQAGAIYTSGFSVCSNGSLALGGSALWWQCLSGDFYNLYDRWWAAQVCPLSPILSDPH